MIKIIILLLLSIVFSPKSFSQEEISFHDIVALENISKPQVVKYLYEHNYVHLDYQTEFERFIKKGNTNSLYTVTIGFEEGRLKVFGISINPKYYTKSIAQLKSIGFEKVKETNFDVGFYHIYENKEYTCYVMKPEQVKMQ